MKRPLTLVGAVIFVAGAGLALLRAPAAPPLPTVTVWKSATCGCCGHWIEHLRAAGFTVVAHDTEDLPLITQQHGVAENLVSCHVAVVGGYVVEGHVPADLIKRLLQEHPAHIAGLSVPGMVPGSPGMETGGQKPPYDVIAWDSAGKTTVYAKR